MSGNREYIGFSLFWNDQKARQSSPDYSGNGRLSEEVLDYIVECWKNGKNPELELAGWNKESRNSGKKFQSISVNIPYKVRQERQDRGGDRDRGRGDDRRDDRRRDDRREARRDDRRDDRQSSFPTDSRRDDRRDERRDDRRDESREEIPF